MLTCQGRGVRAMHRAMQELFGLQPVEVRILPQGKTDPMLFDEVGAAYGLDPAAIVAHDAVLRRTYIQALDAELRAPDACQVKPGVPELLQALRSRPEIALGIVSGNLERAAWLKLRAAGIAEYFAAGAFGSDGRRRADLVALAMQRFAARAGTPFGPQDVWVIGDTPDDVAGGRTHGTRTLAVATGSFVRADLEAASPDVVLDDFVATDTVVDILCRPW